MPPCTAVFLMGGCGRSRMAAEAVLKQGVTDRSLYKALPETINMVGRRLIRALAVPDRVRPRGSPRRQAGPSRR